MIVNESQLSSLIPSAVVEYLDRYIVGQERAKRAVAVALRNRVRRRLLDEAMASEIAPKNILMIGPTGVGKTEIARRLATLVNAPFVKVEATKFTEVGYVGRDVESMIRDLTEVAMQMVKKQMMEEVQEVALVNARERLVDYLVPLKKGASDGIPTILSYLKGDVPEVASKSSDDEQERSRQSTRSKMLGLLTAGKLDDREVEIELEESQKGGIPVMGVMDAGVGMNIGEMLGDLMPKKSRKRRMLVKDALVTLKAEEAEKLIDKDKAVALALDKAQQEGIIFIDEIDKITSRSGSSGAEVSREGVQRDLLPVVEGSVVQTKYGQVDTGHILFIAAGAFHSVKPSDLVPELQGRFPTRVELEALGKDELMRILTEPQNSLVEQYKALLGTEGVSLVFEESGISEIATLAEKMNLDMENIGARRLHTMMEQLLEEISFSGPQMSGETVLIDDVFVRSRLNSLITDGDLRRYLL